MSNPYKIRGISLPSSATDMVQTQSSSNTSQFTSSSGIGIPSGVSLYTGSWFRQTLGGTYSQTSPPLFNNGTAKYSTYTSNTTITASQFPQNVWGIRVVAIGGGGGGGGGGGSANYAYTGGGGGGGGNGSVIFSPYIPFKGEAGSSLISKIDVVIGAAGAGGGTEGRNNGYNGSDGGPTSISLTDITDSQALLIGVPGGKGGYGGQLGNNVNTEQNRTRGSGFGGYSGGTPTMTGTLYNTYEDSMALVNCTSSGVGQVYQNTIAKDDGFVNASTGTRGTNGNGFTASINGADGESRIKAPTSNHPAGGAGGSVRSWTPSNYSADTYLPPWGVGGSPGSQASSNPFGSASEPWATIPLGSSTYGIGGAGGRGGNHDGDKKSGSAGRTGVVWIFWYYAPPPSLPYNTTSAVAYSSSASQYFSQSAMPWFSSTYGSLTSQQIAVLESDVARLSGYFKDRFVNNQLVAIGYDSTQTTDKLRVVEYDPTNSTAVNGVVPPYYMSDNATGYFLYIQSVSPASGSFAFMNADLGSSQYVFQFPYYADNGYTITFSLFGGGGGGGGGGSTDSVRGGGGGSGGNSGYVSTGTMQYVNSGAVLTMALGNGGVPSERTFTTAGLSGGYGQGANAANILSPTTENGYSTQSSDWFAQDGQDGDNSTLTVSWTDASGTQNTTSYTAHGGEGGTGAGKLVQTVTYSASYTASNVTIQQIGADSTSKNTASYGQNYQGGAGGGGGSNYVAGSGENTAQTVVVSWSDTSGNPPLVNVGANGPAISYPTCPAITDYTNVSGGGTIPANGTSADAVAGSEGYGVYITYAPTPVPSGYASWYRLSPTLAGGGGGSGEGTGGSSSGGGGGGGGTYYVTDANGTNASSYYDIATGGGGGGGGGGDNGGSGGSGGSLGPLANPSQQASGSNQYTNAPGGDGFLSGGGGGGQGAGLASHVSNNGANGGRGGGGYLIVTFQKNA